MSAARRASVLAVAVALVASGCGASASEEAGSSDAQKVVKELKSLRAGEIVIKGSSPRSYGPYVLEPGGYVLRFEHRNGDSAKIVVALESKPGSRAKPYALLVDSKERTGTRPVALSGRLYVHVVSAGAEYELRFTPTQAS